MKKQNNTKVNYTPIQLILPVDLERIIKINDAVYSFSEVMAHIDLQKYFVEQKERETGRPRYGREKLLKIVLFGFMEFGYPEAIEEFRFYTPHITRFYDRDGQLVKEFPQVQSLTIHLDQIQPSQFLLMKIKFRPSAPLFKNRRTLSFKCCPTKAGMYHLMDIPAYIMR